MNCPKCSGADTKVVATRTKGDAITRQRRCEACGHQFRTAETRLLVKVSTRRSGRAGAQLDDSVASAAGRDDGTVDHA